MHFLQVSLIHSHYLLKSVWAPAAEIERIMCDNTLMLEGIFFFFYLYETAVPQPGVDLEESLTREAVEGTLEQDTTCRSQETVLEGRKRQLSTLGNYLSGTEHKYKQLA